MRVRRISAPLNVEQRPPLPLRSPRAEQAPPTPGHRRANASGANDRRAGVSIRRRRKGGSRSVWATVTPAEDGRDARPVARFIASVAFAWQHALSMPTAATAPTASEQQRSVDGLQI